MVIKWDSTKRTPKPHFVTVESLNFGLRTIDYIPTPYIPVFAPISHIGKMGAIVPNTFAQALQLQPMRLNLPRPSLPLDIVSYCLEHL